MIGSNEPAYSNSLGTLLVPSIIEAEWDWVEPLLQSICTECETDWEPHHVKRLLQDGAAHLWSSLSGGFAVTQMHHNEFFCRSYLLIWICHSGADFFADEDFMLMNEFAKENNAGWIEIWSPRKGMPKHLSKFGFKSVNTVMRRELS